MLENDLSPAINQTTTYLSDYQAPAFNIKHVRLAFNLREKTTLVVAEFDVLRNGEHTEPLVLDGEKFTLLGLSINEQALSPEQYQTTEQTLVIDSVPGSFTLRVETQLEPHLNTELSGLYQSSGNFCTQCEAEGFRRISYFLDRPDVMAEYHVTITADKKTCPVLLSNGNLQASGDNKDGTHWAEWHDPHPKPCYLFALVAGDLDCVNDQFVTKSGKQVELAIYAQSHNIDKCEHAMQSLIKSMQWDEQVYGREYDLSVYNIVAVDDFNMGAMENKGLNVFNSKYVLANQQTATDADYEGIESVIGHEYFHNWSGNRVTCRDWFQLSLKEGFTVFRDQEFSADMGSRAVKRIRDVQVLRAFQFKEDAGPMAHPVRPESYQEINNFYTVTIYEKGSEVIRMMHSLVGAEGFRKGTDLYFDTFDGQAVTTEDFVRCIEQANQTDLQQFRLWYSQSGTPEVTATQHYDAGVLTIGFEQTCPATPGQAEKHPFVIPISMALFDEQGEKFHSDILVLTEAYQSFEFKCDNQPTISLLRDFSAPIKLDFKQSDAALAELIKVDDNGFTSWEAMQNLSLNLLLPAIKNNVLDDATYPRVLNAFRSLLNSQADDKAILAEMLTLPSATYIAELCKPIDPQAVSLFRRKLIEKLALDLETEFLELYLSNNQATTFSLDPEAMAQRALKNAALSYLSKANKQQNYQTVLKQYQSADNMTDRLAAFASLMHSQYQERDALVEDFYQQWQHDTLVLDKWFAIQAMSPTITVQDLRQLMEHTAFSISNPNKVRSLIGAFCSNLPAFHQTDGSAYQFLADQVVNLDKINPQVAARLVGVFNNWKAFSDPYSAQMKTALERINAVEDLTKDVREIAGKALL